MPRRISARGKSSSPDRKARTRIDSQCFAEWDRWGITFSSLFIARDARVKTSQLCGAKPIEVFVHSSFFFLIFYTTWNVSFCTEKRGTVKDNGWIIRRVVERWLFIFVINIQSRWFPFQPLKMFRVHFRSYFRRIEVATFSRMKIPSANSPCDSASCFVAQACDLISLGDTLYPRCERVLLFCITVPKISVTDCVVTR